MNSVVICSGHPQNNTEGVVTDSLSSFQMEGHTLGCALVETTIPELDASDDANADLVLVQKLAFSCNYRDKTLIMNFNANAQKYATESPDEFIYACIGSDFVGRVISAGKRVQRLKAGDLVIPDDTYPVVPDSSAKPGIPTNEASLRYQVFHQDKLIQIPENMSIEVAASFTIGAQTSYSILRMAEINQHKKILITSARSNTSLFVLAALRGNDNVYALTSSSEDQEKFQQLGIKNIVTIDYNSPGLFTNPDALRNMLQATGGFDVIIDPFIDVHLKRLINLLKFNGIYISCGLYHQFALPDDLYSSIDMLRIFSTMIQMNISIRGNCLGGRADLEKALEEYANGTFNIPVDSVYSGNEISGFFTRTYQSKARWGKVVYKYDD